MSARAFRCLKLTLIPAYAIFSVFWHKLTIQESQISTLKERKGRIYSLLIMYNFLQKIPDDFEVALPLGTNLYRILFLVLKRYPLGRSSATYAPRQ